MIPWDLTKLNNLTLGLGRHAARNLHKAGQEARLLGLSLELEEAVGWPRIQAV